MIPSVDVKKESSHLRFSISIILVLAAYRLTVDLRGWISALLEPYTRFPLFGLLTNLLFLWLLILLWLAYREWQKADLRRRELEDIFASINPDVLLVCDGDGVIRMCSQAVKGVFGYDVGDVVGRESAMLYFGRHSEDRKRDIVEHLEEKGFYVGYATGRKKDGSTFPLELIASNLLYAPGCVVLLRDIADWKEAESELVRSENRHRTLVESAPLGILSVDKNGQIRGVNSAFVSITGCREARALCGTNLQDSDSTVGLVITLAIRRCLEVQKSFSVEERFISAAGRDLWVQVHVAPVLDVQNELLGAHAMIVDVTERRLLQEQFLQAQKMEAVGRLAGGVAHDFNNLLTTIMGYADMAKRSLTLGNAVSKDVNEILAAATKAAELTRQLLAFSRRQTIQPRVIDLNSVILGTDSICRRLIGEDVELVVLPQENLWHAKIDPGQIEQCILNLVVNARDAMPDGGKLQIRTANVCLQEPVCSNSDRVDPGEYVRVSVSDTGMGMSEEVLRHLFEPFFSTKDPSKGTGLGLASVYGIVHQSGGHTVVSSIEGKGSLFELYFPRVEATAEPSFKRETNFDRLKGTETILVAEDERSVREFVANILSSYGYRVLTALNGEDALRVVRNHSGPIHLLLTDVIMPRMGGSELAELMRATVKELKVLYVSGYVSMDISRQNVSELGDGYLQKPFTGTTLARKVREVLDAKV